MRWFQGQAFLENKAAQECVGLGSGMRMGTLALLLGLNYAPAIFSMAKLTQKQRNLAKRRLGFLSPLRHFVSVEWTNYSQLHCWGLRSFHLVAVVQGCKQSASPFATLPSSPGYAYNTTKLRPYRVGWLVPKLFECQFERQLDGLANKRNYKRWEVLKQTYTLAISLYYGLWISLSSFFESHSYVKTEQLA
jgi:hypothetical protein